MSVWDAYKDRLDQVGISKHNMLVSMTKEKLSRQMLDSPSCREVVVNGKKQFISITHHAEDGYKKIASLPGQKLRHGGLVDFANGKWLITQVDPDEEFYQKGVMRQCNHILRWISPTTGQIQEKWCVVEDGTKYLIGERTKEFLTIGDGRMAVTIAKDRDTVELCRGLRFLIDDEDSDFVTAYQITKSNKLFNVFHGEGVFRFILNEVQLTDNDNTDLRIADYYDRMKDGTAAKLCPVFPDYYIDKEMSGEDYDSEDETDSSDSPEDKGSWI